MLGNVWPSPIEARRVKYRRAYESGGVIPTVVVCDIGECFLGFFGNNLRALRAKLQFAH